MRLRLARTRLSTANLQAVYPWMASPGLGDEGVYIGQDRAGAAWCFDPWALYQRGLLTNPNILVAGQVGSAKSSLVKTFLWRQHAIGRRGWVIDPKGEYGKLAAACGVRPLALGGGSTLRLNPLDPGSAPCQDTDDVRRRRVGLVSALAAATLERLPSPDEITACELAVRAAERRPTVTLPEVVDALLRPDNDAAREVMMTATDVAAAGRQAGLALRRLVHGDLAGILDGPTSDGIDPSTNLMVLDLSALLDTEAEPLVMLCAHSWLQQAIATRREQLIVVIDEAWRVLRHLHIARWLRASWKLSRAWGVCNIAVIHRLSDLAAAGNAGSEQRELARGLLADTETRVIYRQPEDVRDETHSALNLTDVEAALLPQLPRAHALWHVGRHRAVVTHRVTERELAIADTDDRMGGSGHGA